MEAVPQSPLNQQGAFRDVNILDLVDEALDEVDTPFAILMLQK